jgi:PDZ domain-containing secreted protein
MRKLSACLLAATLGVAPASTFADAPRNQDPWEHVERFEWSTSQGRLGVMVMSMTPELRQYFNAPNDTGVLVVKVQAGSPAAKAGIKVGDVLTNVRGERIGDAADVLAALSTTKQGDKVTVQLVRDKQQTSIEAAMTSDSPMSFNWLRQLLDFDFDQLARSTTPRPSSST